MFDVQEHEICGPKWKMSDFQLRFSKDLMFVHFNGDIKEPLMNICKNYLSRSSRNGKDITWVNPDLELVTNCGNGRAKGGYVRLVSDRTKQQHEAMKPAWEKRFPYAFNQDDCVKQNDFTELCPKDMTLDQRGQGSRVYQYMYADESVVLGRGPECCGRTN
jgi:hypothetical protein